MSEKLNLRLEDDDAFHAWNAENGELLKMKMWQKKGKRKKIVIIYINIAAPK